MNEAKTAMSSMPMPDRMETNWKEWNCFFDEMGNICQCHHALVKDVNTDIFCPSFKIYQ